MDFFKKLSDKYNKDEKIFVSENRTEEINQERAKQKELLKQNLQNLNFTEEEITSVLDILERGEKMIQVVKDDLIGTNINPENDPGRILKEKTDRIREIELKTASDIKTRISEILQNKNFN